MCECGVLTTGDVWVGGPVVSSPRRRVANVGDARHRLIVASERERDSNELERGRWIVVFGCLRPEMPPLSNFFLFFFGPNNIIQLGSGPELISD